MKQKSIKILLFFLVFIAFSVIIQFQNVTYADSKKSGEQELQDAADEEIDRLDTEALQDYFDNLTADEKAFLSDDFKAFIKGLVGGKESLTFENVMSSLSKYLLNSFIGFLPALISVVVISMLYGVLNGLSSGFLNESTGKIVYFACYGAALVILMGEVIGMINLTVNTVSKIGAFMQVLFPVLLTLMTALGGITTVGITKPLMVVAATYIVGLVSSFVVPCFVAAVILSVVGNMSGVVKLDKLSEFFRKAAEWTMTIIFGVFLTVLTVKGIVGRTSDGLAVNAAKFAVGSFVPIIGSYLSDGFDVAMAGCILIKNAVGVTGMIVLLSIVLAPAVKLLIFTLALKLAAAVSEPVGGGKISDLLNSLSKCTKLLLTAVLGVAFMLFAVIMLVITCCNLGVV